MTPDLLKSDIPFKSYTQNKILGDKIFNDVKPFNIRNFSYIKRTRNACELLKLQACAIRLWRGILKNCAHDLFKYNRLKMFRKKCLVRLLNKNGHIYQTRTTN